MSIKELKELLKKHDVCLGVDIDGDTHGISAKFIVEDRKTQKETVLVNFSAYIGR